MRTGSRPRLRRLLGLLALLPALSACTGFEQLSGSAAVLNREVATLQDEMVLKNILRRSESRPPHFSALPLIRGRNRVTSGFGLGIPFGRGDGPRGLLEPNIEVNTGPGFDYASLNNEQFLVPLRTPMRLEAIANFLRAERRRELLLTLTVETIRWRTPEGTRIYHSDPERPEAFAAFQQRLESLLDQGLTVEQAVWIRTISPPFRLEQTPVLGELGFSAREGLLTEEIPSPTGDRSRWFQLRRLDGFHRLCFNAPGERLATLATCGRVSGEVGRTRPRFVQDDPRSFGGPSPLVFDAGADGRIEIELRSLMEVLDFLGAVVRLGRDAPDRVPTVRGPDGLRAPIFRVLPAEPGSAPVAATDFDGRRLVVPNGRSGGHSGEVFTFVTHMVGAAQSVVNIPITGAVVGD